MFKVTRLLFILALAAIVAGGLWYWRTKQSSLSEDDDQIPVLAWKDLTENTQAGESVYQPAQIMGTIVSATLNELSGIAASRRSADLYWVHNDSGDRPRIFAVNARGDLLATFRVVGAVNEDWEDIASGPGPKGEPALYLADMGDNALKRDFIVVYRVREPELSAQAQSTDTEPVEPFQFVYPDGRHDAEALVVDPSSGQIYIVTKTRSEKCAVYRSPAILKMGTAMKLERVEGPAVTRIAELRLVTGAAAAPDGSRIVIRTYFSAFEFRRAPQGDFSSVFAASPISVALPLEPQGEAITYTSDSKSLITTSEKLPARLQRLDRKK
jgi:hypothetical protein